MGVQWQPPDALEEAWDGRWEKLGAFHPRTLSSAAGTFKASFRIAGPAYKWRPGPRQLSASCSVVFKQYLMLIASVGIWTVMLQTVASRL